MAKIVVLSWCEHSLPFESKYIKISESDVIYLGRSRPDHVTRYNGLFIYPEHIVDCKVSRNHATLTVINDQIHVKAIHAATFINGRRIQKGDWSPVANDDILLLGHLVMDSPGETIVALVRIFNTEDDDFKYFCLIESQFPLCSLPMSPPDFPLDVRILYAAVMDRINVLKRLFTVCEEDLLSSLESVVQNFPESYAKLLRGHDYYKDTITRSHYEFMKRDLASQYVLAIACGRTYRLRNWLIHQERKLFILRWLKLFSQEKIDFLDRHNIVYEEISTSAMKELASEMNCKVPPQLKYFKVPFVEAPTLVKSRRSLLKDGLCYIGIDDMYAPVAYHLGRYLTEIMSKSKARLYKIWHDDRLRPIIKYLENNVLSSDRYTPKNGDVVTERNVHTLCDESFPLCMKILQFHLQRDNHLRNGGRFQYTLFLKAIGLPLSNSMFFWKMHFRKRVSEEVFVRRYSYHIRHAYGLEGKMADYPPQNCAEILKGTPGPLEYHGCPFKVLDQDRLIDVLKRSGLKIEACQDILNLSANGSPQNACARYFEMTQGETYPHPTVVHPNDYYDASRNIKRRKRVQVSMEGETGCSIPSNRNDSAHPAPNGLSCQSRSLNW
ncbi:DNA primase large subunit [Nesidiocoris tenuis]|uniref:DNA primase large subunit n=1 Tax=Nesidiocoris tenuis TaxID=355587 RepID=A0ABN7AYG1_9HEMI|nr:DNA primase large subunit [Nesidiocoris tenuis]